MGGSWRVIDGREGGDTTVPSVGHIDPGYLNEMRILREDSSTMLRGDNYRAYQYSLLQNAISVMIKLNVGNQFRVDPETGENAANLLALISNNYNLIAPKLLPHDEEVLALTWTVDKIKALLTVEGEDVDLLTVDLKEQTQKSIPLNEDGEVKLAALLKVLSGSAKAASK